jgi:hypothetical protein
LGRSVVLVAEEALAGVPIGCVGKRGIQEARDNTWKRQEATYSPLSALSLVAAREQELCV